MAEATQDQCPKAEGELQLEAAPVVRMVCTGKALGQNDKPCWIFQVLSQSNEILPQAPILLSAKGLKHVWVGEIITIKMSGSTYWPSTAEHVATWQDDEQRLQWQTEARAWDTARRVQKQVKDEKNCVLLKKHLEPLRRLYTQLPALQAISLLAEIIYYVEYGSPR